jgi:hypothetical protein
VACDISPTRPEQANLVERSPCASLVRRFAATPSLVSRILVSVFSTHQNPQLLLLLPLSMALSHSAWSL